MRTGRPRTNPLARFWQNVMPEPNSGCWLWIGALSPEYAQFRPGGRAPKVAAHRWAYEQFAGAIHEGLVIDHLCRIKKCVNPAHLEAVTPAVNNIRAVPYRRRPRRKLLCKWGHPLATAYIDQHGTRLCRVCAKTRNDRAAQRRRIEAPG